MHNIPSTGIGLATCKVDQSTLEGSESFYPMRKGERIYCTDVGSLNAGTTYYISFKLSFGAIRNDYQLQDAYGFGDLYIQGHNSLTEKVTYARGNLLSSEGVGTLMLRKNREIADYD